MLAARHGSGILVEPWRAQLSDGDSTAAWDAFIHRYQRLIIATIRHVARDHDDVMDVFARVCEALRADDLARLRRFDDAPEQRRARFSTWLVAVVHNITIDWIRARDGRSRNNAPPDLSPLGLRIFQYVITEGRSHVE